MKTAVCLFAYRRPEYLKRSLATHKHLADITYYAFVDYSEMQSEVVDIIKNSNIYDVIIPRAAHMGIEANQISGFSFLFNEGYDAVIALEDDWVLREGAITYLHRELELLQYDKRFFSISGHKGKFSNTQFRCSIWGIWVDRWNKIDWGKMPSNCTYDLYLAAYMKKEKLYCRCSSTKLIKHIGWRGGTHVKWYDIFSVRRILRKYLGWPPYPIYKGE